MTKQFPTLVVSDFVRTDYSAPVLSQVDAAFRFIADEVAEYQKFFNDQKIHLVVANSVRLSECTFGSQNFFEDRLVSILAERGITNKVSNPCGHIGADDLRTLTDKYGFIRFLSSERPNGLWVAYQLDKGYNCY